MTKPEKVPRGKPDLVARASARPKKRLDYSDFKALEAHTFDEARAALTEYLRSPVGQDDLKTSPHSGRPVDDVVADLLKELFPFG